MSGFFTFWVSVFNLEWTAIIHCPQMGWTWKPCENLFFSKTHHWLGLFSLMWYCYSIHCVSYHLLSFLLPSVPAPTCALVNPVFLLLCVQLQDQEKLIHQLQLDMVSPQTTQKRLAVKEQLMGQLAEEHSHTLRSLHSQVHLLHPLSEPGKTACFNFTLHHGQYSITERGHTQTHRGLSLRRANEGLLLHLNII